VTHALFATLMILSAAPRTLRVDYLHTGNDKLELFSVDRLVIEPTPWPGNIARAVDDTNLGKYFFEIADADTGAVLYSRGFNSIYGEWELTAEAKQQNRTFSESLRFPEPPKKVKLTLKKRDPKNAWVEIWTTELDPKSMFVDPSRPASPGPLLPLMRNGEPADKVDLLILGDGYSAKQRTKFEKDARKMVEVLFAYSPFKERRKDFNVWGLCPAAAESGISRPLNGIYRRSPVGATYDAFGSERYILTFENRAFRDLASFAPYEFVEIMVNNDTYGGGGIFNLYSTMAVDSRWAPYLFVHEFGHHFAGLADEYFTSDTYYEPDPSRPEPWELNATALKSPADLKWKQFVEPTTPIPTPWDKERFETESREIQKIRRQIRADHRPEAEMDALFAKQKKSESALLASQTFAAKPGAFEGCNYESVGYYRPQVDCVMFSRNDVPFCRVCQDAIERVINLYTPARGP
jgi:hypothetical protein